MNGVKAWIGNEEIYPEVGVFAYSKMLNSTIKKRMNKAAHHLMANVELRAVRNFGNRNRTEPQIPKPQPNRNRTKVKVSNQTEPQPQPQLTKPQPNRNRTAKPQLNRSFYYHFTTF